MQRDYISLFETEIGQKFKVFVISGRGGTGSFISDHGLIITNWHVCTLLNVLDGTSHFIIECNFIHVACAFQVAHDAVRQASIKDGTDYLSSGFVAQSREQELKGADYEVASSIFRYEHYIMCAVLSHHYLRLVLALIAGLDHEKLSRCVFRGRSCRQGRAGSFETL